MIHTDPGRIPTVIRGNPSQADIRAWVLEQNRRAQDGEPVGPHPADPLAHKVQSATIYASEEEWLAGSKGKAVSLAFADSN